MVRLFVSGLPPGTTCEQLQQRFQAFGAVSSCIVAPNKTYQALPHDEGFYRGFGFVEVVPHDDAALRKCMTAYNGSKWRGHVLKCQLAKPDYMQLLQQEKEEGQQEMGTTWRKLPPLEAGATLRIRHPTKPATVEVQLASGQKKTSFPPAAPVPHGGGSSSSWEPLPVPPGARYTFEERLREIAERMPAPVRRARESDREDQEGEGAEKLATSRRGAAIQLQYSPTSSQDWGGPSSTVAAGTQRGPWPGTGSAQHPAQQAQQAKPKKRKVVDFMDEEEERGGAAGQRWSAAVERRLADLSRFASDSEEEQAGPVAVAVAAAAAADKPSNLHVDMSRFASDSEDELGAPLEKVMAITRVQRQQPKHQQAKEHRQQPVRQQQPKQQQQPAKQQQAKQLNRWQEAQVVQQTKGSVDFSGGFEMEEEEEEEEQQQGAAAGHGTLANDNGEEPEEQQHVSPLRLAAQQERKQKQKRKQQRVTQLLAGQRATVGIKLADEGRQQGRGGAELGRFVSDSDSEEEVPVAIAADYLAGAAPPEHNQQQEASQQPQRMAPGSAARPQPERRQQQQLTRRASAPAQHPAALLPAKAFPGPLPAPEEPPATQVLSQQPQRRKQAAASKVREIVDFLSPQDQQQLRRRAALDLSRFGGSDSEDEGRPAQQGQGHGRDGFGQRTVPQFDGAWESEEDSSSSDSDREGSEDSRAAARRGSAGGRGESNSGAINSCSGESESDDSSNSGSENSGGGGKGESESSSDDESDGEEGMAAQPDAQQGVHAAGREHNGGQEGEGLDEEDGSGQGQQGNNRTPGRAQQAERAPAWLARVLPSGAGFVRQGKLEQLEATWRASREGWAQDYRAKHRQAVRHLSRPAGNKKQRRK